MNAERILAALTIGLLIGLLVIAAGSAQKAQREASWATEQMRVDLNIIDALKQANETLQDRLAQQPTERIVTVQQPCRQDVGHQTPIFGRDAQVYAGR